MNARKDRTTALISSLIADALPIKEDQSYGLCRVSKGRFN
jgi:hypothetical protein